MHHVLQVLWARAKEGGDSTGGAADRQDKGHSHGAHKEHYLRLLERYRALGVAGMAAKVPFRVLSDAEVLQASEAETAIAAAATAPAALGVEEAGST